MPITPGDKGNPGGCQELSAQEAVVCVPAPHLHPGTKAFLDQFAEALSAADEVVLADIYAARETDTLGVSSRDIARTD